MRSRTWVALGIVPAVALVVSGCGGKSPQSGHAGSIHGAGSRFAAPIIRNFSTNVQDKTGVTITYTPMTSAAGIAQWAGVRVDFAASSAALTPKQRSDAAKKQEPVQFPIAVGSITLAYNLPGVKGLKLDGATLGDIYLGKVKKWNDPAIKKLNRGAKLPSTKITPIHRSDQADETDVLTTFLAGKSGAWKKVGKGTSVKWPTGTAGAGDTGVAKAVSKQGGAIGYIDLTGSVKTKLALASIKNKSGNFVAPTAQSTNAVVRGLGIGKDYSISTLDSPNPKAYPIAAPAYLVVYRDMCRAGVSKLLAQRTKALLDYAVSDGQNVLQQLGFAKLSPALKKKAEQAVSGLVCHKQALNAVQ